MEPRVLLVVRDDAARDAYRAALANQSVTIDTIASLADVQRALFDTACNGILLDVGAMVHASASDKALVSDLLELFPVLRLRWDPQAARIQTLYFGQTGDDAIDLTTFVQRHCARFPGRSLRRNLRRDVHLNVEISPVPGFGPGVTARTNTLNLSAGGCFVFSAADWSERTEAWLRICELAERDTIAARVAWWSPWGQHLRPAGVGLEFQGISGKQRDELSSYLVK